MYLVILLLAILWLAYSNGANDNFKGVATLLGSGTASFKKALIIANVCTLLGSLVSVVWADTFIKNFSGKGLVAETLLGNTHFILAVGLGAAATVFLASRLGFPISTTHALTGALVGGGMMAPLTGINTTALWQKFFLPLMASPFLALALSIFLYWASSKIKKIKPVPSGKSKQVLDAGHFFSAAAVSFARGLNDTPKIAALLIASNALALPKQAALTIIGLAMVTGGLFGTRKVAHTMSHKITQMNPSQGFLANVVTAFLVIVASKWGVPVSTTHVSCGSLFGIGIATGQGQWKSVKGIVLSWVITLPLAGLIAAGVCITLNRYH